jgi:hypothetical protein
VQAEIFIFAQKGYNNIRSKVGANAKGVQEMTASNIKVCAVTDESLLKDLGRNPEVICARCGAKSHMRNNLCEPVAIEPDH